MGAPVDTGIENFEEVILGLSKADRVKLVGWIAESLVEEDLEVEEVSIVEPTPVWPPEGLDDAADSLPSWHDGIPRPEDLTKEEWEKKVNEVAGSWADHPMTAEELIEDIYSSRTISTREINLDD